MPLKAGVVDEEFDGVGLDLTAKTSSCGRLVHDEAYRSGRGAGNAFEPHCKLG
jgi:hypothetical protein